MATTIVMGLGKMNGELQRKKKWMWTIPGVEEEGQPEVLQASYFAMVGSECT